MKIYGLKPTVNSHNTKSQQRRGKKKVYCLFPKRSMEELFSIIKSILKNETEPIVKKLFLYVKNIYFSQTL